MKKSIHLELLVFSLSIVLFMNGCAPASTSASAEPLPANTLEANMPLPTDVHLTIAEAEELAGFDVKEPTYLPAGVSLDYATSQKSPYPNVTLISRSSTRLMATWALFSRSCRSHKQKQCQTRPLVVSLAMTVKYYKLAKWL